jgi:hypothetical protein
VGASILETDSIHEDTVVEASQALVWLQSIVQSKQREHGSVLTILKAQLDIPSLRPLRAIALHALFQKLKIAVTTVAERAAEESQAQVVRFTERWETRPTCDTVRSVSAAVRGLETQSAGMQNWVEYAQRLARAAYIELDLRVATHAAAEIIEDARATKEKAEEMQRYVRFARAQRAELEAQQRVRALHLYAWYMWLTWCVSGEDCARAQRRTAETAFGTGGAKDRASSKTFTLCATFARRQERS